MIRSDNWRSAVACLVWVIRDAIPGLVVAGNAAKQVFAPAAAALSLSFSICLARLVPFTVDEVFLKTWESYSERVRHVPISAQRQDSCAIPDEFVANGGEFSFEKDRFEVGDIEEGGR